MHILLIVSWYKTDEFPMKGSFFEEQARGLIKQGHKVSILFPEYLPYSSKKTQHVNIYNDNGINTYHFRYRAIFPRNRRINYFNFQKKTYNFIKTYLIKNNKPNIIHAHTVFYGGLVAKYISDKIGVPYIITEHFTRFMTGKIHSKFDIRKTAKIYQSAKLNIIVSHGFRNLLLKHLKITSNNFIVIPNMVSDIFFTTETNYKMNKTTPVFFTMSFLSERKNHKLILNSFKLFLLKVPNAILKIGGDGTIADELKKHCKQLNISKNVYFLGELTRNEVKKEINEMDIFLLASKFETFGVVLIEALANGKPIISTDCVGPRDIVTKFNGILSKSFEKIDFLQAMEEVYNNYDSYNRQKIVKDCYNRFSEKTIINQLIEQYLMAIR